MLRDWGMLSWVQGEGTRVGETPPTDQLHLLCLGGDPQPHWDCGVKTWRTAGAKTDKLQWMWSLILGSRCRAIVILMVTVVVKPQCCG